MLTLKEQLDAELLERGKSSVPVIIKKEPPPRFGNPYREEYLKSADAIREKLIKRGKPARPSKKSKGK